MAVSFRLLLILLLAAACDDDAPPTLGDDEFVEVLVDLRRAERRAEVADSASVAFDSLRDEVLGRHGVTPEDLRRYVAAHGSDLRRMERVWERIERSLRRVEAEETEEDTLPSDTAGGPRPPEQDLERLPLPEADTGPRPLRTVPVF